MDVSAAFVDGLDVGPRQSAHFGLVKENGLLANGAFQPAAFPDHLRLCVRVAFPSGRNQSIRFLGSELEVLFDEASMALAVDLKRNQMAALIFQLLEATRRGGQREADGRIAAVTVA